MSRHQLSDEDEPDSNVPLLADYDHGLSGTVQNPPIPNSFSRSFSHEVKYTFEPCTAHDEQDTDSNSDYSHISIRPRHSHQEGSPLDRDRPPPYSRHAGNSSARFQRGLAPFGVPRACPPYQSVSLEDVSERDQPRNWSPSLWGPKSQGYQAGYNNSQHHQNSKTNDQNWSQQRAEVYNFQGYRQGQPHSQSQSQSQDPLQGLSKGRARPDELGECVPPRLAPVSGVLSETPGRKLIRPVAFKPGFTSSSPSTCQQCGEENSLCVCSNLANLHLAGPVNSVSSGLRSARSCQLPVFYDRDRPTGNHREPPYLDDDSPGVNVDESPTRKVFGAGSELLVQTPSPSDSGVGELEAMLREREAEISTLRQVMDRNERAIFQVYEEKRSRWLQDMQEIQDEYEHKLRLQQQKAGQLEQALASQVRRLQHEKYQLMGSEHSLLEQNATVIHNQIDSFSSSSGSTSSSRLQTPKKSSPRVECSPFEEVALQPALQDKMAMKNTEILGLRSQLLSLQTQLEEKVRQLSKAQEEVSSKAGELKALHEQLDQLSGVDQASVCEECTQTSVSDFSPVDEDAEPVVMSEEEYTLSLERQIDELREQLQAADSLVETERLQWVEEKNKVIRYQKQLQLNYIQMQRKNTALEAEVEQLTLELESRELKLGAMNGEESAC